MIRNQPKDLKNWFVQLRELKNGTVIVCLGGYVKDQPEGTVTFTSEIIGANDRMILTKNSIYVLSGPPSPLFRGALRRVGASYDIIDPLNPEVLKLIKSQVVT